MENKNARRMNKHESVFWVIPAEGSFKYNIIYDFCGHESHCNVWFRMQKIYPQLKPYDYEHFPRGRVWKNKAGSPQLYTIFIPSSINTKEIIEDINNIFDLNNDFVVETY